MIVGVSPSEGLRVGYRWGLGLFDSEIHLRTLTPVVLMDRLVNRGVGERKGAGGGGWGMVERGRSSPDGGMGMAQPAAGGSGSDLILKFENRSRQGCKYLENGFSHAVPRCLGNA